VAGAANVFSFATICPVARGEATAGGPAFGKSASKKRPMRRARRQ
jgi:hypothetical protein